MHHMQETHKIRVLAFVAVLCALLIIALPVDSAAQGESIESKIWRDGTGSGFNKNTFHVGAGAGVLFGRKALKAHSDHSLAMGLVEFGWIFTDTLCPGKWYGGNLELRGELFAGSQYEPRSRYFVGITPLLRYNFMTGSRWVPFVEVGAGFSGTDIGRPDLSNVFNFNIQGGFGTHYFFAADKAISVQYRFLHFSNAGIEEPNRGVDTMGIVLTYNWFF